MPQMHAVTNRDNPAPDGSDGNMRSMTPVCSCGCTLEVAHIIKSDGASGAVAACISRLIGDDTGHIPRGFFESRDSLLRHGCDWASRMPEGLYWNVQGNAKERLGKIVTVCED